MPAGAHEGDPGIQTLITGIQPVLPGVSITTIQDAIAPALSAVNDSGDELEVLGPDGVPFLRLGRTGAFGNITSPAFFLSAAPSGETSVPSSARPGKRPVWVALSRKPAWAWYDQRVPGITTAAPAVRARPEPTRLASFSIPLLYGGRGARAQGEVDYRPPRGGPVATMTSPIQLAPGVTVALTPGRYPDVYLQNQSSATVTIEGQQGEPFAQIGPRGVRVNLRSPIHEADALARGGNAIVRVEGSAAPLWRTVSTTPTYDWLDPRPRFLPQWTIPVRVGARAYAITGKLAFVPATTIPGLLHTTRRGDGPRQSSDGASTWAILAAALIALAAGLGLTRRRARRA